MTACALHDYNKFFDSIEIIDLLKEAVDCDYPLAPFLLAIDQHLAPRVIQCQGICGEPINVFRSIVAGCTQSKAITKAFLKQTMSKVVKRNPDVINGLYIDDTIQLATSPDPSTVADKLVPAMLDLCKGLGENICPSDFRPFHD